MKTNCWLILGTMLATSVVAQVNNNNLPTIPPPAAPVAAPAPVVAPAEATTNAPAKHVAKSKKKSAKKARSTARKPAESVSAPVTLVPGPATVDAETVNLRGQAGLQGEVIGHVKKGDSVTVISEITLDKPKAGEPAQWAKIALPADIKVWVDSKYVDVSNNVVDAKKLNLRGGPGENYSVLGVIEKGTSISSVSTKGNWMQIQPPANAFAFVAASYLKQEAGAIPAVTPPPVATVENVPPQPQPMPATQATVAEAPAIAPPAPVTPAPEPTPAPAPETANTTPPAPPALPVPQPTLVSDNDTNLPPPPPRVVTHEGYVRHSVSLVAPTYFELFDPENDKAIDYLFTTSTNLNLNRYDGMRITATGEEALDVRWKDTPVLTIQKIYVLPMPAGGNPASVKSIHPHK